MALITFSLWAGAVAFGPCARTIIEDNISVFVTAPPSRVHHRCVVWRRGGAAGAVFSKRFWTLAMKKTNLGKESERIEFKKSTGELKEGVIAIAAILNKHGKGELIFGVKNNADVVAADFKAYFAPSL